MKALCTKHDFSQIEMKSRTIYGIRIRVHNENHLQINIIIFETISKYFI
jgi:hypothetical protein